MRVRSKEKKEISTEQRKFTDGVIDVAADDGESEGARVGVDVAVLALSEGRPLGRVVEGGRSKLGAADDRSVAGAASDEAPDGAADHGEGAALALRSSPGPSSTPAAAEAPRTSGATVAARSDDPPPVVPRAIPATTRATRPTRPTACATLRDDAGGIAGVRLPSAVCRLPSAVCGARCAHWGGIRDGWRLEA